MFKKTLLALSVATLAASANAGTIYSSAKDGALPTDLATGTAGAGTQCASLGATLATDDTDDTSGDDTLHLVSAGSIFVAKTTADERQTPAADACDVTVATDVSTSTAKSPIEAPAGSVSASASIVAGVGGYRQEDTITINFSGAKLDLTRTTAPTLTTAAAGGAVFDILDVTETTIRYTVRSGSGDVPGNAILQLGAEANGVSNGTIVLDSSELSAATEVSIDAFATNTSGTNYDVIAETKIAEFVPQYSVTVDSAFDGIIDVSDDRQALAKNGSDNVAADNTAGNQDTLELEVEIDATVNKVAAQDITFVIKGDFSWVADLANSSDDGKVATAAEITTYLNTLDLYKKGSGSFGDASSYKLNSDLNELTITDTSISTADAAADDYAFRLKVPGKGEKNPVLAEQTFSVSVSATDGVASPNTNTLTAGTDVPAGAWTLNGSVVTIPYMPFGPNTKVIMRHTNTGVQSGDVSVRYMLEGVSTNWENLGVVTTTTRGVKNIRDLVIDAIMADAGVESGKVAIEITSNVPDADVTVYAGFNVKNSADDRGFVGTFGEHGSAK